MAQNHPFVDGNKRTAFDVTDTFLRINGVSITATPDNVIAFIYALYDARSFNFADITVWLRENTA